MSVRRWHVLSVVTAAAVALSTAGGLALGQQQPQPQQSPPPLQQQPGQLGGQQGQQQFGQQPGQPGQQLQQQQPGGQQQFQQAPQPQQPLPSPERRPAFQAGTPSPAPAAQRQQVPPGVRAVGGLVDVATANFATLNQALETPELIERLVRGAGPQTQPEVQPSPAPQGQRQQQQGGPRVVVVDDRLAPDQLTVFRQAVQSSTFLLRNAGLSQAVVSNSDALSGALRDDNVAVSDVLALEVIGQPTTIYALRGGLPLRQATTGGAGAAATPIPSPSPTPVPTATPTPQQRGGLPGLFDRLFGGGGTPTPPAVQPQQAPVGAVGTPTLLPGGTPGAGVGTGTGAGVTGGMPGPTATLQPGG